MKPLSRRTLLRGTGALIGLPLLDAMLGAHTARAQNMTPRRLVTFYFPNGVATGGWHPTTTGPSYTLTPSLLSLAPVKSKVAVFGNVANRPLGLSPGGHSPGTAGFMSCVQPQKGLTLANGISLDQVVANMYRGQTRLPSIELGTEGGVTTGGCANNTYPCAYQRTTAWTGPSSPLSHEIDPGRAFDRLFAGYDPTQGAAALAKRKALRLSVLDAARDDVTSLNARVGSADKAKLDEYFTALRAWESQVQALQPPAASCQVPARPGTSTDIRVLSKLMLDLIVLAFRCDMTRVASFMLQNTVSNYVFGFLGVSGAHHGYSHHLGDPTKIAAINKIVNWEVGQFAYLVQELDKVAEGSGTLLSNSLVLMGSDIADSNRHNHDDIPLLVAGGGVQSVGQYVRFPTEQPMANVCVSALNLTGIAATSFGADSTGPLSTF